jgi:hypothetical protein
MNQIAETPAEFTERANTLLQMAIRLSAKRGEGKLSALNRCLSEAKARKMTWIEGLEHAVQVLRSQR